MQALYIHNKIVDLSLSGQLQAAPAAQGGARVLAAQALEQLPQQSGSIFVDELRRLLQKPNFQVRGCALQQTPGACSVTI